MVLTDLDAVIDRKSSYYRDGFLLAKEVIAASGRSLRRGGRRSWTFLFRTPIPVEEGLRSIIRDGLLPVAVGNTSVALGGTTMRVHPDLIFGDLAAVGDVKYKTGGPDWDRGDLYQVVAFATAADPRRRRAHLRAQGSPRRFMRSHGRAPQIFDGVVEQARRSH